MMALRFGAEYGATPIFNLSKENMGHVDVEDLGILKQLSEMIVNWDNQFQRTFNEDYPPKAGLVAERLPSPMLLDKKPRPGKALPTPWLVSTAASIPATAPTA